MNLWRHFRRTGLLALVAFPLLLPAAERKPNVIFILTDDQNNDTLGCFGGRVLTPQIDRLAGEGSNSRAPTRSRSSVPPAAIRV